MKKQIILILSFLLTVMCLTGCSQEKIITEEKISEMAEIARSVASQKEYVVPEGYEVSYPDEKNKNRIKIIDNTGSKKANLEIVFNVSKEEVRPVEINIPGQPKYLYPTCMIIAVFVVYGVVYFFERLGTKIEDKIEEKRQSKKNKSKRTEEKLD